MMIETQGGRPSPRHGREVLVSGSFKVLILAGRLNSDGGGWPLTPLVDRLERRGCRVQVLCLSRGNDLLDDPRVVELSALENRWLRTFAIRGLWSDERLERPDLLHVVHDEMDDVALDLAENAHLPYIQTVSRFGTVARGLRLSRKWCRRLIATSSDLAEDLIEELGVPQDRLAVIPPGIASAVSRSPKAHEGNVPVVGTGGPLEEASGLMIFLEAARLVLDAGHDVEFLIATEGTQQLALRHYAQRLCIADRVTVANYPSVSADFWRVLDIYCQPAVVASTGRTLIQALAHAIPCIATDVRGLRALIDRGKNGLIVAPNDPGALMSALITILDCPDEAHRLGSQALHWAQTLFDPDAEADRLVDVYLQAASVPDQPSGLGL
jgi:glycosyltransferase involved in cell wall biosynthesis